MKRFYTILSITAVLIGISVSGAQAQFCDQAQGTAGFASDPACEASVCGIDAFCCTTQWDGICAGEAAADAACAGCLSTGGGGFCDQAQATAGFPSDPACEAVICALDPFCCTNTWDGICAGEAAADAACIGCLSTTVTAFCDEPQLTAGFPTDLNCQNAICPADPFCCNTQWDAICAASAAIEPACAGCLATAVVVPANDLCGGALPITCGVAVTGTTVGATLADAPATCTTVLNTAPGVWYSFVGTGAAVTFSTCTGTAYDSKIGIFQGPCGALTCIAGNDDACGLQTTVTGATTLGTNYLVYVTGFGTATGAFSMSNDLAAVTPTVTAGGPTTFCTGGSVTLTSTFQSTYAWSPSGGAAQSATVSTAGSYTVTGTINGCTATSAATAVTVNTPPTATVSGGGVVCNGVGVTVSVALTGAAPWNIVLNGTPFNNIATSPFTTTVTVAGTYTVSTVSNSTGCPGTSSGSAVVTTGSTPVAAFTSTVAGLTANFTDASTGIPTTYAWTFGDGGTAATASPSHTYAAGGTFNVCLTVTNACGTNQICQNVTVVGGIVNDLCGGALPIACGGSVTGTTVGADALVAPATCTTTLNTSPGIWYVFAGTGTSVTMSTCTGTAYDSKIGVFSGTCAALTCVAGNDDACALQSSVTFNSVLGTNYFIYVTGFGTATGAFTLTATCATPITNDLCGGALPLTCGATITATTVGADALDAPATCTTTLNTAPGIWYTFFGTGATVSLNTCTGTTYDSKIGVFAGPCTGLTCVAGNDDACGLQTTVNAPTTLGTQYFVYVTGFGTATGAFTLTNNLTAITPTVTAGGPTSFCAGGSVTLTSSTATTYAWAPSGGSAQTATITTAGSYTVTTADANACSATSTATAVTVNTAPTATVSGGGVVCNGVGVTVSVALTGTAPWSITLNGTPFTGINTSPFTTTVTAAATYTVSAVSDATICPGTSSGSAVVTTGTAPVAAFTFASVGLTTTFTDASTGTPTTYAWDFGDGGTAATASPAHTYAAGGTFNVCLTVTNACGTNQLCQSVTVVGAPVNDLCGGALPITCGSTVTGTTATATLADAPGAVCGTGLATAPGVWYIFAGTGDVVTVSTCTGTAFDTKLGVFSGACATLTCVGGNDDACALQSTVTFLSAVGTNYFVYVTGFGTNSGAFTLTTTCTTPPPNNLCGGAINLICGVAVAGTTVGATNTDAPATCTTTLNTAPGVWYTFFGTGAAVTLNTCTGTAFDTKIGVFSGTCAALTCVLGNDDAAACGTGLQSSVTFATTAGIQYFVYVTGFGTASGAFSLSNNITPIGPSVTASGPLTFCAPGTVTLSANSATSYNWAPSGGTAQTAAITASGSYTVTTIDVNACTATSLPTVVTVNPAPTAVISGGTTICAPASTPLTITLTGTAPWTVVLNDGAINTTLNIAASPFTQTVSTAGTYTITSVTDATTCTGTGTGSAVVVVNTAPVAGFTFTTNSLVATFTDASTGGPTTYAWDFGDGGTDATASPTHTYAAAGTFNVCLTVTNSCGTNQLCQSVTVTNNIPNDLCGGAIAVTCGQTITGTTVGADLADAPATCTTILNTAPGIWYEFIGTGDQVTISTCTGTAYDSKLGVFTGPCTALTCVAGNDDACGLQSTVAFNSILGQQYLIYVSGFGTATGAFTMTITCTPPLVNDLCGGALPITCGTPIIGSTVGSDLADAPATCTTTLNTAGGIWYTFFGTGAAVTFNTCTGTTYDSKIGVFQGPCTGLTCVAGNDDACGLQSTVAAPTTAGTQYFVYVTGFGAATGAFTLTSDLAGTVPTVTASGPTTFCGASGTVTLTSSTSTTYNWLPTGGAGQSATITTAGSYTVTTVDQNGCSGTSLPTVVSINPAPTATLSGGATICSPNTTDLTITLTGTGPWTVVLNDGSANTTLNIPTSPFTQAVSVAGTYTITSVTDASTCTGTGTGSATVVVNPAPTVVVSGGGLICGTTGVTITGTFTGTGPWNATLSDGTNSFPLPPIATSPFSQVVTIPGTYTVTVLTDAGSCPGTTSGSAVVTVGAVPVAGFTSTTAGLDATFTDASTGTPTTYAWDFGDSGTSGLASPTHTYATGGTYTVCLTVTNACGTDQDCQPVTVASSCTADAGTITSTPINICMTNGSATIVGVPGGNALVPAGFSTVYGLTQGGIVVQAGAAPSFTVTAAGTYTIHTFVLDPLTFNPANVIPGVTTAASIDAQLIQGGGTICASLDMVGATVNVFDVVAPVISAAGPLTFCSGGSVDLTSTSATTYTWTPSGATQTISATTSGDYSVSIVDANGCSATSNIITVSVTQGPTADLTGGGAICDGVGVDLSGVLTGTGPWDVVINTPGGPFPITGITASPYTQNVTVAGTYTLVSVTDASGCTGSVTGSATVTTGGSAPTAGFTASSTLLQVAFTDGSTGAATYAWDFGDAGTSALASPTHTYAANGTYNVCLTVTNGCGTNQICQSVTVNDNPCPVNAGTLNASAAPACLTPGQTVNLSATPSGNAVVPAGFQTLYILVQGGVILQTNTVPDFAVNSNGIYTIHTLIYDPLTFNTATIQNGVTLVSAVNAQLLQGGGATCGALALSGVNFNVVTPVLPTVTPTGPLDICPGSTALLTCSNASQYLWLPTQQTSSFTNASAPGDYTVTTVDANGCIATSAPVVVTNLPVTTGLISTNVNTLTVDQLSTDYQWFHNGDPVPGGTAQFLNAQESGYYWVVYTDPNGCQTVSDTIEFSYTGIEETGFAYITVYPNPSSGQFSVAVGEAKEELTFMVTDLTGRVLYRKTIAQMGDIREDITLDVANGTYMLQVSTPDGRGSNHLIQVVR